MYIAAIGTMCKFNEVIAVISVYVFCTNIMCCVTSAECLADPFNANLTLENSDFLQHDFLINTITDTHFDNPDRRGRMFTLLARMHANGFQPKGIACEEYTAVCIDETGIGHVYGFYPTEDDYAYFLFANCNGINNPETLTAGLPLTWIYNQSAVYAYKVSGDNFGTNTFNLNTWQAGTGTGSWEFWYVDNAVFNTVSTTAPSCSPLSVNDIDLNLFNIFPNPITNELNINIQNMIYICIL